MKKSRFTTEQIIGFIKQAEAGMAVAESRASMASVCQLLQLASDLAPEFRTPV